jgi:hypothetical protein
MTIDFVPTGTFDWTFLLNWPGVEIWGVKHSNAPIVLRNEGRIKPCEATCAPEVIEDE